jgi:hypothetical protein
LPRQIICLGPDFFSHACADRSSSPAPSLDSRTVLVRHPVRSEVFISFTREAVRRPRLLAVFFLCGRHVPRSRSSRRLDSFPVFRSRSQFPARRPTSGVRCAHPRCVFDLSTAVPFSFATRDYAARRFWQPVSRCFVFSCDSCSSTRGFFGSCARFVLPHDSIQTSRQSASGLLLILPSPVLFSDRACPVLVSPGPFPARLGFCSGKLEFGPGPRGPDWLQFLLPRSRFLSICSGFAGSVSCPLRILLGEIGVRPRSARSRLAAISPTAVTIFVDLFFFSFSVCVCPCVSVTVSDCLACVLPQGLIFTDASHFLLKSAGGLQLLAPQQVSWPCLDFRCQEC